MKHFLEINSLQKNELIEVLELSHILAHTQTQPLLRKNVLFCFEKPSLRTKVGTEVAINQLGGKVIHVGSDAFLGGNIVFTKNIPEVPGRESLKDTVLNVSKWCNAIFARVFAHRTLETLSKYSEIPIINALSDTHHPMQALADLYTIRQKMGKDTKVTITFIGDSNNVAMSLIELGLILGYTLHFCSPKRYAWSKKQTDYFEKTAATYGGVYKSFFDPKKAVQGAHIVYADTFVSMGEENMYKMKIKHFQGYQINIDLLKEAGKDARFMHCLPAHRGIEVTDEVMDHPASWIYDQAENRAVVSKGLFTYLLTPF